MFVKMLEAHEVSPDGIRVLTLEKGQVVELSDAVAQRLIDRELAKPAGKAGDKIPSDVGKSELDDDGGHGTDAVEAPPSEPDTPVEPPKKTGRR